MRDNTRTGQVVVEDIPALMSVGTPVFDLDDKRIGDVADFDLTAGYMQVRSGGPDLRTLYLPFRLITTIDPREIYLSQPGDKLIADYATLPTSQVVLEQWKDWRTGRTDTIVGHQMQSGYSGQPVTAFQQTYSTLASQFVAGMTVRDINGESVGKIHQFDSRQGWLSVEKGPFGASVTIVPFSAVARVETADNTVHLLIAQEALRTDLAALAPAPTPATVTASQPTASA